MTKRTAVVVAAALAVAGCGGGDSTAEKTAQQQVCDARADISRQLDGLRQLTPSTVTSDTVRGNLQAIRDSLRKIRDAQPALKEDRRADIRAANQAFTSQVGSIATTILRSASVDEARAQLQSATDQLRAAYRSTLGTVDCG
jgi:outer membrane protein TolC